MDSSFGHRCKTLKLDCETKFPKDRISRLPDDILVRVLSMLTLKEAGRTSVLSKIWRHVWAYVPALTFDGSNILQLVLDYDSLISERNKFLRCVDQVVSSHKAPTVDEFKLRFYLDDNNKADIDKWVSFATEKRVKRLGLELGLNCSGSPSPYMFPCLSSCNSLTSLELDYVAVTGKVLERIICNCKALGLLSVTQSRVLLDLKVASHSLRSLKIRYCHELVKLEIDAPHLVSVDYAGPAVVCMPFKSAPNVTELYIGGCSCSKLMSLITPQIKLLKISTLKIKPFSEVFPNCTGVKTLDFSYYPESIDDMFRVSRVIKACPSLQRLVIQLKLSRLSKECETKEELYGKECEKEEEWYHYQLKTVEIVGFATCALRFAEYLIQKVVSLDKLIIDTQPPFERRYPGELVVNNKIVEAKEQAYKLRPLLKHGIEFDRVAFFSECV